MKLRLLVLVVILGIGAIIVGWMVESRLLSEEERADLEIPDKIDYFLTNLHYRAMNNEGTLDYEFVSPRLEHHPASDVSHIEKPSIQIYREVDHWQVDSLNGELFHKENIIRLRNQVVIRKDGENPMQMYTESIRFEPDIDRVTTEAEVLIRNEKGQIEADEAIFDLANQVYWFNRTHSVIHHGDS